MSRLIIIANLIFLLFCTCKESEKNRIPNAPVSISFTNNWSIYGVTGPYEAKQFIKNRNIPSRDFFVVSSATGFGGVLLTCGSLGEIRAFDLACPVEASQSVIIEAIIDGKNGLTPCALCPKCGSTFDIFEGSNGAPMSGEAKNSKYFLKSYRVNGPTSLGSCTILN